MIFRQLFDPETSTYTYLLGDPRTREAALIDPVRRLVDRDLQLLSELRLNLVYAIDTHVHADHITGASVLRRRTGCKTVVSQAAGCEDADVQLVDGDELRVGIYGLEARATPGHTNTCMTYVLADLSRAFTGDTLMIRGCGRTDFQSGDARQLYESVQDSIFSLPDDTLLYPGHDYKGRTVTTVREEKVFNPRLGGGTTEDEFEQLMGELKLSYPRKIDVAVPANQRGGYLPGDEKEAPPAGDPWAPLTRAVTGAPHIHVEWVSDHLGRVQIIDVREPDEWSGPLGHLAAGLLVPLDTVEHEAREWDRAQPIVVVCRSGGRSDRAAQLLEQLGFQQVASMVGGMNRWNELSLPVVRSAGRQG